MKGSVYNFICEQDETTENIKMLETEANTRSSSFWGVFSLNGATYSAMIPSGEICNIAGVAARKRKLEFLKLLIKKIPDMLWRCDTTAFGEKKAMVTPMEYAISNRDLAMVKFILEPGNIKLLETASSFKLLDSDAKKVFASCLTSENREHFIKERRTLQYYLDYAAKLFEASPELKDIQTEILVSIRTLIPQQRVDDMECPDGELKQILEPVTPGSNNTLPLLGLVGACLTIGFGCFKLEDFKTTSSFLSAHKVEIALPIVLIGAGLLYYLCCKGTESSASRVRE